jgi:phosphate transport system substrate-binding protein
MKGPVLQFPVAFGAITVSYDVPGLKSGLKLDGSTLANIFLGKITKWNSPAIAKLNPGVKLPTTAITVVHRGDSSGTTNGFTTYLSDVSATWKARVGAGPLVNWPVGLAPSKNAGVAAAISNTAGSIGYVEQAYALANHLLVAKVKNSSGKYVLPSIPATSAAADGIAVPANLGVATINSPNRSAYPIVSPTFLVVYKDPCKNDGVSSSVAKGIKSFLTYAFSVGQKTLGQGVHQLRYAPLPSSLQKKDQKQLRTMVCNGSPIS